MKTRNETTQIKDVIKEEHKTGQLTDATKASRGLQNLIRNFLYALYLIKSSVRDQAFVKVMRSRGPAL